MGKFFESLLRLIFGRKPTLQTGPGRRADPIPQAPPPVVLEPAPSVPPPVIRPEPAPAPPPPPPAAPPPPPASPPRDNYLASLVGQDRRPLARADYEAVAARLGCEWEALAAVSKVESGSYGGFGIDGRPTILYERHLFSRKTNSAYDVSHPDISNRQAGGYPRSQPERWDQLARAYALAPDAALESASYGRFQILGQNKGNLGMNVHDYVAKMARSERDQLEAFEGFIRANSLQDELQTKDWAGFARRYNGPNYAINQYDVKMAQAYAALKANPAMV